MLPSRGSLASNANIVRGTFETDPISALGLPPPVSIGIGATVGAALAAIQEHGKGYVLIVEAGKPRGIMSEREVLMKIVTRDVKYDSDVAGFASTIPVTLMDSERIARAVKLMVAEGIDNIPIIDKEGRATAVLRTLDVIHFLAQAFPEQLLNLPPRPNQTMPKPEGG
jgi:CBS domain-containing protein